MSEEAKKIAEKKKISKENFYDDFHELAHKCIIYSILIPYYHLKYKVKIFGTENIPKRPYIIASNHFSYSDPTILAIALKEPIAYVAKQELFDDKKLSGIITFLGSIPINREKPGPSSLKRVREAFNAGWPIGIFIEGTRNQSREYMTKLEPGAAFIAKFCGGAQVLPMGIQGGEQPGSELIVKIGQPIQFDEKLSLEELTLQYGQAIAELAGLQLQI